MSDAGFPSRQASISTLPSPAAIVSVLTLLLLTSHLFALAPFLNQDPLKLTKEPVARDHGFWRLAGLEVSWFFLAGVG